MKAANIFLAGCLLATSSMAQVVLQQKLQLEGDEDARTLAYTTNSKRIVIGGSNGSLIAYELTTSDHWKLPSLTAKVVAVEVSYDGRYLAAAAEDGSFLLYDLQEIKQLKLNGDLGKVRAITFSPSNTQVATGSEDGKIRIWNVNTRDRVIGMQASNKKILALAFSPAGNWLASGSADHLISVWDPSSGQIVKTFNGHTDWIHSLSFNPKGNSLASGSYDKTIRVWDMVAGKESAILKGHRSWVTDVQYSPDGQYILSGGADGQAIIWGSDGKLIHQLKDVHQVVGRVQFAYDGKTLAVADLSRAVQVYNTIPLNIQPWKPFDVTAPSLVVLSPKLLTTKDAASGYRKSVVHNPTVRVLVEITDPSGVKEVFIGGEKMLPQKDNPDRYEVEMIFPINTERAIAIKATDNLGNSLEDKLLIEHKRFSGSVDAKKYHALLIAVQDYKNDGITDLDQPISDMNRLKKVLETQYSFLPENISVLQNPDRHALYDKLDELQARLDQIDNLLIFYAGHGYWDEQLKQGYWLPSDAEPNKRSTWLSNGALRDYIGGMNARHTLLIADACFSGGIFKSRSVFENASTAIETLYLRKSRKAMTSGTLETVPDKSVFMNFLVKSLEDNQEPYLPAEELFSSLRKAVINRSPNNQVPQYGEIGQTGDEGGEFIFIRKN